MSQDGSDARGSQLSFYDALGSAQQPRSLRRLPRLFRKATALTWSAAPRELVVAGLLELLGAVAVAAQLLLARSFLGSVLGPRSARGLAELAPELVGLGLVTALAGFAGAALEERQRLLGELTLRFTQGRLLDVATSVKLEAFDSPAFHDQLMRASVNAQVRPFQLANGLLRMTSGVVGVAAVGLALLELEPLVVPLIGLAFVPLWVATTRNSQALYELSIALTPTERERAYLQQLLVGKEEARELRAFQLAPFLRRRYDELYERRLSRLRQLVRVRQRRSLVANLAAAIVILVAVAGLVQLTLSGRIALATAGAAALGVQQLTTRLRGIFTGASLLYECSLFLEDVTTFLDLQPHPTVGVDAPGALPPPFTGVQVENLSFTYPGTDEPVLRRVDLELRRGQVVALVGENGSGKSTLVKLLCGLYQPSAGHIVWSGTDAAQLDPAALRRQVAVVFQDFLRYQLTGAANIGMGDHHRFADLEGVRLAASRAGAHHILDSLPQGYETLLSRAFVGGTELSLGQWQRVALARTFFRDAPLIVLDEPAAALDARAEHELFEQVRTAFEDRAVLLISHRFSTVRSADRIYVMANGEVVESGSHDELIDIRGRYAELFELQAAAYRESSGPRPGS